jgi:superfamily II DNA or RNA helicase
MNLSLFSHQREAVDIFFNNQLRGSLLFATGTGKTEIAIGIIQKYEGRVLFLAPIINLVEQTHERLKKYDIDSGMYYTHEKTLDKRIVISTYQSVSSNLDIINNFDLVIFDEAHLCSLSAKKFSQIVKKCHELNKHMLSLTATLDTTNKKYELILEACPVLKKIELNEAIENGHLTPIEIHDKGIDFTVENKRKYLELSDGIRNLSNMLGTSNPVEIATILKSNSYNERTKLAASWLKKVNERKKMMELNEEKTNMVLEILGTTNNEQTIIFTERIDTLENLKQILGNRFEYISAKTKKKDRLEILSNFGKTFNIIGTVHTLDLGYDVPNIKHGIILASNKNQNTIVQRIGRVVRKSEGKTISKIYIVYARNTHEEQLYQMIKDVVK